MSSIIMNNLYRADIYYLLSHYDFSELNDKTILITGSTGLICSALVDVLIFAKEKGVRVSIICAGRDLQKISSRFEDKVFSIEYDALTNVQLPDNIDFIVHGAGIANPELYTNKPVETMLSNFIGVRNLLEYCINKTTKIVYISSSEVYGQKQVMESFDEHSYGFINQDNIRNSYSEAKRASEMLCRAYARQYGVHVSMIRPGHVYGPTASRTDKRISSVFSYKAADGGNLELMSTGLQQRSYCYCLDAAAAILVCLFKGEIGEAYNIGTEKATSIIEMAKLLAQAGSVKIKAKEPTKEDIDCFNPMDNSVLSYEKLHQLGYTQYFSSETGLTHTVQILKTLQ